MTEKNAGSDSWGQLLSEFGLEDEQREHAAREHAAREHAARPDKAGLKEPPDPSPCQPAPWKPKAFDEQTDAGESAETADESKPKEKKSIFSRFPKINFFGVPPEASLDAVIEGVKSPSLGGKAFTDSKLEKMPVSQERTERLRGRQQEKETADVPNAWSAVASQINVLASGSETPSGERPARRAVASMFDDPVPEPEELRKCKDLMGEQQSRRGKHEEAFFDEETDYRQRDSQQYGGRGRRDSQSEEKEVRGRGSRYRKPLDDDLPESDFEPMEDAMPDEMPGRRERGRRGSRQVADTYRDRDRKRESRRQEGRQQEEWSEVDAALQSGRGSPDRGSRRTHADVPTSGRRRRPERAEDPMPARESSDGDESGFVALHKNIPSWDEAVYDIIVGNIARHKSHSGGGHHSGGGQGHSGRGRR